MSKHVPVITIDGPSGTGKGTITQLLAQHLGWHLLDSGALYRVVAVGIEKNNILINEINKVCEFAGALEVAFGTEFEGSITLNGNEISHLARLEETAEKASKVAAIAELRAVLLQRQRDFCRPPRTGSRWPGYGDSSFSLRRPQNIPHCQCRREGAKAI